MRPSGASAARWRQPLAENAVRSSYTVHLHTELVLLRVPLRLKKLSSLIDDSNKDFGIQKK